MALCALLALPILGLTGFHIVLVIRARTTNEQVTGKFRSGFNPFTTGCLNNALRSLCTSQYPNFNVDTERKKKRAQDTLTVSYFPESFSIDGHIRLKKSGSIASTGTASIARNSPLLIKEKQGDSVRNLYEEDDTPLSVKAGSFNDSVVEMERRSNKVPSTISPVNSIKVQVSPANRIVHSYSSNEPLLSDSKKENPSTISVSNGSISTHTKRPLKFTEAVRMHDNLTACKSTV